jgi:hypothetical protein
MQSVYPLGPQTVSLRLPPGVKVRSVELLCAEKTEPFHVKDQLLRFTIPSVGDYEVAAVTVS